MAGAHGNFYWNELLTKDAERAKKFYGDDDVDARVKKATAAGAKLMKPIFDVPNVGRIAILTEPGGAGVGWITPVN
jgi:predicted enzyme related to lactoylglutathione lyase